MALGWHFNLVVLGVAVLVLRFLTPTPALAKAFYSKEEALALAFPQAEKVDQRSFFLTDEQAQQVATLAAAPVESKLATFYVGQKNGTVMGYAFIETHIVRTQPETFLIVLSPTGSIQKVFVLAFYEPEEYLPTERWLHQFDQQVLGPELQLRRNIHGIAGATLTARAVTSGVRRVLALFQVLLRERQ